MAPFLFSYSYNLTAKALLDIKTRHLINDDDHQLLIFPAIRLNLSSHCVHHFINQ